MKIIQGIIVGVFSVLLLLNTISEEVKDTTYIEQVNVEKEEVALAGPEELIQEEIERKEFVISLVGDCSIGKLSVHNYEGSFDNFFDIYGSEYFFSNVSEYFRNDDMTLVNFEGVLTDSKEKTPKEFNIKGRPEFIDILTSSSVEAVTFGNNHRIDYGQRGCEDTIDLFDSNNISWAYDQYYTVYESPEGYKVGYVSVNAVYDPELSIKWVENGIEALKNEDVDIVLVACHWGEEKEHYPTDYQKALGRHAIDLGADLVIGCHPHVLQGFEKYNDRYIIYSLGNFCFGGNRNPKDKNSMIVQATFTLENGELIEPTSLKVVPCRISGHDDYNDFSPIVVKGDKADRIIEKLNKYSEEFGVKIYSDGLVD